MDATFQFPQGPGSLCENECVLTIHIEEKDAYYDISYLYNPSNVDKNKYGEGEIIAKNSFSEELVKYLLMSFDELEQYSGASGAIGYKLSIMKCIQFLWD